MRVSKNKMNTVYYLALLDWGEKILPPDEMDSFTKSIICTSLPPRDGWTTCTLTLTDIADQVSDMKVGYYHSRLIFTLRLKSAPKDIINMRLLRTKLEKSISRFLEEKIVPAMKTYIKAPRIFIYPVIEIQSNEAFWDFGEEKPYSLPTTCFYTELEDPRRGKIRWILNFLKPKKVEMRVSGAKIITSEMSNWFFWNLTNMVFHEGLYRQSREKSKSQEEVHSGLENRLEDFASNLMTNFYEVSNARSQDLIAKFVLALTILGVIIAIVQFVFPLFPHAQTLQAQNTTSTAFAAQTATNGGLQT